MKQEFQVFHNTDFGELNTLERDGQIYFIGNQVAILLGYSNYRKAVMVHVDDEDKLRSQIGHAGQLREVVLINESGLYSLVLSSKLPKAKEFKRWVTNKVLPSIRKNGGYLNHQNQLKPEEVLANALLLAKNLIDEKEHKLQELKPKAMYFDSLMETGLLTNFRNTAKELGFSQTQFITLLLKKQYIYRDKKQRLLPYAHKNKGYFEVKEWCYLNGHSCGIQTLITPKGRQHFLNLILGDENEE